MPRFTYLLAQVSPGGAGRNRVLNKKDFLELNAPFPPLKSQEKVASILDDAESAIWKEIDQRNALRLQKRGLLQRLLTGEWQVGREVAVA
jgi:type I restriction enzyme S subunit